MPRWIKQALAALLISAAAAPARAETITIGLVGAVSATHWPIYVGLKQGFYAAKDIQLATVFTLSSNALVQQLAAGSLDAALSTGIVDPIYAIDKGAAIAVLRLEMVSPPYALMAKPAIASIKALKGKTVMVDGPKGITRLYVERMLAANGLQPGDVETLFAGATSARFSALVAGAIDATILLPPFNFFAELAGFRTLGLTVDYTPELPFTGAVVNRSLGSGAPRHARPADRGPQSEHGVVSGPAEPGAGHRPDGGGHAAEAGGCRQGLRFPAIQEFLRRQRPGVQDQDECHAGRAAGAGRYLAWARCRSPHLAGRDAGDGVNRNFGRRCMTDQAHGERT